MSRTVIDPPAGGLRPDGTLAGGWWHEDVEHGRIVCDLCPRECHLKPGDRGFCFVRQNVDNEMVLTTYGRSTGFCIDPIEKKTAQPFFPRHQCVVVRDGGVQPGVQVLSKLGHFEVAGGRAVESVGDARRDRRGRSEV